MQNKRYPLNGTFELTGRCNLQCRMCLMRVNHARIMETGLHERTAEEWIHMAEQVAKEGTISLLLTGGEPMLRPDFAEIYEAIAKMGFVLNLYTNATMVTDPIIKLLQKYPPHKIGVTMYGASNETYQKLCASSDGYDRFRDGVDKLSSLPSLFSIRTTIVQDNVNDLAEMRRYTEEKFGPEKVLTVSTFVMNKIRCGIASPVECRLTPEEHIRMLFPQIIEKWEQTRQGLLPKIKKKLEPQKHSLPQEGQYLFESCRAGIDSYAINWSGRMYACEILDKGYTEPFETGFRKAWEDLPEQYPRSITVEKCRTCPHAYICSSCPAYRLGETGDWFGVPEYACRTAKFLDQILQDVHE